jgi:hypothetical protein
LKNKKVIVEFEILAGGDIGKMQQDARKYVRI